MATGTSTISATLGGVTGSTLLTVSPAVLQSIALTPANPSVPKGESEQFTATGTYSDSSTQDLTTQVTWASATISVATISNVSGTQGLASTVGTGTSTISATLSGVSGSTLLTVTAAALRSIVVTPANPSLPKGESEQFTATGTYSDNTTQDLTSQATWESLTTAVATITSGGSGDRGGNRHLHDQRRAGWHYRFDRAHGDRRDAAVDCGYARQPQCGRGWHRIVHGHRDVLGHLDPGPHQPGDLGFGQFRRGHDLQRIRIKGPGDGGRNRNILDQRDFQRHHGFDGTHGHGGRPPIHRSHAGQSQPSGRRDRAVHRDRYLL